MTLFGPVPLPAPNEPLRLPSGVTPRGFADPLPQEVLDLRGRDRVSVFPWRGQFSPQLIEALITAYCPPDASVLDPFVGSGTVLREAAAMCLPATGFEINPSAWAISRLHEFACRSHERREVSIGGLRRQLRRAFPVALFEARTEVPPDAFTDRIRSIGGSLDEAEQTLLNALVIVLDIFHNRTTPALVHDRFAAVAAVVRDLPHTAAPIRAELGDARALSLEDRSVDFVVTSPPYINVFNYHQNYRRSVETLGWDVLRVAKSEIGSNRANRGNRFLTVIQYCVDMAAALSELARVLRPAARALLIVGYESRVLRAPFFNADLVERLAAGTGTFRCVLRQQRTFTTRYGRRIREDVLHLVRTEAEKPGSVNGALSRRIARTALEEAAPHVSGENARLLESAIESTETITGTPLFSPGANGCANSA